MDDELFELSEALYKSTYWETPNTYTFYGTHWEISQRPMKGNEGLQNAHCPEYNTDFLLDKLLLITSSIKFYKGNNGDVRLFYEPDKPDYKDYVASTPLKALLKLTLALHEAGEL